MVPERVRRAGGLVRPRTAAAFMAHRRARVGSDVEHLEAAVAWLERAQDATGTGGVAARFDLASGWDAPYPETTGYIIGSLLHEAQRTGRSSLLDRSVRMGEWLLTTQHPEGYVPGGLLRAERGGGRPEVFNTGQVLFGWLALHETTGDARFADAARRAADWLRAGQDDDGAWRRHSLHGVAHTYYSRVTWAMARAGAVLGESDFTSSAARSIDWVCDQATAGGWIGHMSFTDGRDPLTHTMAYTIEGLLECALLLDRPQAWQIGRDALAALEHAYRTPASGARLAPNGDLAGTFRPDWTASASYACVTGSAQVALCCQRVDAREPSPELRSFADDLAWSVKRSQAWAGHDGVQGGVPGSAPLWGKYGSFKYLNWAAKFTVDMLLDRVTGGLPADRFG